MPDRKGGPKARERVPAKRRKAPPGPGSPDNKAIRPEKGIRKGGPKVRERVPAARRKAPPEPDSPDRKAIGPDKREETLKGLPYSHVLKGGTS